MHYYVQYLIIQHHPASSSIQHPASSFQYPSTTDHQQPYTGDHPRKWIHRATGQEIPVVIVAGNNQLLCASTAGLAYARESSLIYPSLSLSYRIVS